MSTSTTAVLPYSIVIDETSGNEIVQCNLCHQIKYDVRTIAKSRKSVKNYYCHNHYNTKHKGRHSQPNKRFKGPLVEVGNNADNIDDITDNDFSNNDNTFDDEHSDKEVMDHMYDDVEQEDAVNQVNNDIANTDFSNMNTGFDDDMSIGSQLSILSNSSSLSAKSADSSKTFVGESIEEWLASDNTSEHQYSESQFESQSLRFGFHEFDIYRNEENREDNKSSNCSCQVYFYQKHNVMAKNKNDKTGGWRGLVERALSGSRDLSQVGLDFESELLFRINSVLLSSSRDACDDVMDLVDILLSKIDSNDPDVYRIPKNYCEARRVILDGTFSTMVNFPCPRVFSIDGHACVSLKESIQIMAGHHGNFEFIWDAVDGKRSVEGLNGLGAATAVVLDVEQVLGEKVNRTSIGLVYFWSDSYLNSWVKQKDNSVWLFTATISPPASEISKKSCRVVLAIGKSSNDHSKVIEHFYKEILELRKGFKCYYAKHKQLIDVAFDLLYHSADRPERQSLGCTLGEGEYGMITNHAAIICPERLPACPNCLRSLLEKIIDHREGDIPSCENCLCWTIKHADKDKEAIYDVPKDYPRHTELDPRLDGSVVLPPDGREPGREKIGNIRLSTEWLIQACTYAYEAYRQRKWTKNLFSAYLRTCCVNEATRDIIAFVAEKDRKEGKFRDMKSILPQVWYLFNLFDRNLLPDMPMHLLAHGVSDDVIQLFSQILKQFKMDSKYARFANIYINDMATWNLSWLKLKEYPKAAWVGENTMAYVRIQCYLYGLYLANNPPQGKEEVDVILAAEENPTRERSVASSTKKEVNDLVDSMRRMLNAYQAMISRIMSTSDQDPHEVLDHIKLFMSTFHRCDSLFIPPMDAEECTKKKNKELVVDQLSNDEIFNILLALNVRPDRSGQKSTLDRVKKDILIRDLRSRGLVDKGNKRDLQCRLFGEIIGRTLVGSAEKRTIFDMLTEEETQKISTDLRLETSQSLKRIPVTSLKSALRERGLPDNGDKEDLQLRLFCHIIDRTFNTSPSLTAAVASNIAPANGNDIPSEQNNSGIKGKKRCAWMKGGLLSLLANYVQQYSNFGQCQNIW